MNQKLLSLAAAIMMIASGCSADNVADITTDESSFVSETEQTTVASSTSAVTTSVSYEIDSTKPVVALTFDDGPNLTTTMNVLSKLDKYNVRASFFLIGDNITDSTERVVKRAYDMGCEIDNHSQSHSYMNTMSAEDIRKEVMSVSDRVEQITGEPTKFFRPPYIAVSQDMYDNIDMPFISGYGCDDWNPDVSVDERVEKTLAQVTDGSIILLHDAQGNSKTVEALDSIIPALLDEGYQFVTVSELFEVKGIEISPEDTNLYSVAGK